MQWTPLGYAIDKKNVNIVALLLNHGAAPNAKFVREEVEDVRGLTMPSAGRAKGAGMALDCFADSFVFSSSYEGRGSNGPH